MRRERTVSTAPASNKPMMISKTAMRIASGLLSAEFVERPEGVTAPAPLALARLRSRPPPPAVRLPMPTSSVETRLAVLSCSQPNRSAQLGLQRWAIELGVRQVRARTVPARRADVDGREAEVGTS